MTRTGYTELPFTEHDLRVAVQTVLGEARGEGPLGMLAVSNVILNRCHDPRNRWPNLVRDVCLEPRQFSCWIPDGVNAKNLEYLARTGWHDPLYREAAFQFLRALTGATPDPTGEANHYHPRGLPKAPVWAEGVQPTAFIGNHIFYHL